MSNFLLKKWNWKNRIGNKKGKLPWIGYSEKWKKKYNFHVYWSKNSVEKLEKYWNSYYVCSLAVIFTIFSVLKIEKSSHYCKNNLTIWKTKKIIFEHAIFIHLKSWTYGILKKVKPCIREISLGCGVHKLAGKYWINEIAPSPISLTDSQIKDKIIENKGG